MGAKGSNFIRLGSLEAEVLDCVWRCAEKGGAVTVRDCYEALRTERQIAYTTVMTVLGNLTTKGFVARDESGIAYLYTPLRTRREVASEMLLRVADVLLDHDRALAASLLDA